MKRAFVALGRPDVLRDIHIYGGLALACTGAWWVSPAAACLLGGAGLFGLGMYASLETAAMIMDRLMGRGVRADVSWHDLDDRWYTSDPGYSANAAGVPVTPERAMRVSTVFACVSLIAETLASVPCMLYRRLDNGGKERAKDHPLYRTVRYKPNRWQTAIDFFGYGQAHSSLRGGIVVEIQERRSGVELVPIHPDLVQARRLVSGGLKYEVRDPGGGHRTLTSDEVLSVRDLSTDGLTGLARAKLAREAIAVAVAEEQFAGGFFRNDASGRLVVSHKAPPPQEDARRKYVAEIQEKYAGVGNTRKPMVLWNDATATEVGTHDDGRFIIEPRRFQATDVARFWRVPGILIGMEDRVSAWGTGVAEIKQGFTDLTMRPSFTRWEQSMNTSLLTEDEQEEYFFEFELKDLLRGDLKTRSESLAIQRANGVISPNEWRIIDNMNPREGGDEYQDNVQGAAPNTRTPLPDDREARTLPVPLLQDAARRIAGMEAQERERRGDRANYGDVRTYAVKVLSPLGAAFGSAAWVVEETATRIERTAAAVDNRDIRVTEIAMLIEETFRVGARVEREAA